MRNARPFLSKATMYALMVLPFATLLHSQAPPQRRGVVHATWSPAAEQNFGLTKQDFVDMGLGALTPEQYGYLLVWMSDREQKAKNSVARPTFTCGRPGASGQDVKPESYDTVRVYVTAIGEANEIISGVRQRLRAMNGTEVVYSSDEADLVVSLVTLQTQSKSGYPTGVALSVVVSQPCVFKLGTYTSNYDTVENQLLQVGSDVSGVVDSIVSTIDTRDLEEQRKANAAWKKYLREATPKR